MPPVLPGDALGSGRHYRSVDNPDSQILSTSQQRGLAALISIAEQSERDHGVSPERDWLDRPTARAELSATGQQTGLAALVTLAQQLTCDSGISTGHGWAGQLVTPAGDSPTWLVKNSSSGGGEVILKPKDTDALMLGIVRHSRGAIEKITKMGPTIARTAPRRTLRKSTFTPLLNATDRVIIGLISLGWLACFVNFWVWWLKPSHEISVLGTVLNSAVLVYLTAYPAFYMLAGNRLRDVTSSVAVPLLRVAFIVTRAPSEPWHVARATLIAMLSQEFPIPYDVWLADESPTSEILAWCNKSGVIVSTRNGVQEYHRPTWPRRTKCKEGNLAYFYDHWGYSYYDVVAQLDCDHVPSPSYLAEMVRPFSDPAIGYVAAPSVCDTNAGESWSARGRLYNEASFHGAYQLGHSDGMSPVCIGSHYAVRTAALASIGGIGPELAEDFTTSYLLTAAGWHGAFAIGAEAHGDGPPTFGAMVVQEYQWSKSITVALLSIAWPNMRRRLTWTLRFRFIYHLLFYTLLIVSTLGGILLCLVAAVSGKAWVSVNYVAFVAHLWTLSIWLLILTRFIARRGLLRPWDAPPLSWENTLYVLTRWPYILRGICAGVMLVIHPRPTTFKVTPKGSGNLVGLPVSVMYPYLFISIAGASAAIVGEISNKSVGYVFLCIILGFLYSTASVIIPLLHARESALTAKISVTTAFRKTSLIPMIAGILVMLPTIYAAARYPAYMQHILHWQLSTLFTHVRWQSLLE